MKHTHTHFLSSLLDTSLITSSLWSTVLRCVTRVGNRSSDSSGLSNDVSSGFWSISVPSCERCFQLFIFAQQCGDGRTWFCQTVLSAMESIQTDAGRCLFFGGGGWGDIIICVSLDCTTMFEHKPLKMSWARWKRLMFVFPPSFPVQVCVQLLFFKLFKDLIQ